MKFGKIGKMLVEKFRNFEIIWKFGEKIKKFGNSTEFWKKGNLEKFRNLETSLLAK